MGLQRIRHDWATELNWTELFWQLLVGARGWVSKGEWLENVYPCKEGLISPTALHTHHLSAYFQELSHMWYYYIELATTALTKSRTVIIVAVVVQSLTYVQLFVTPWTAARQASLSFTISWSLLKLMCIELVMSSNHVILCCPLLLLPSIFPSIWVFFSESALCIRWPNDG